jgi:hypothetical protein
VHEKDGQRVGLLRALSLLVGCVLGLAAAVGLVGGYIVYCRLTHTPLDERLRGMPMLWRGLADPGYRGLQAAFALHNPGFFRSTWDLDRSIAFSRALFVPATMYGERKYRYKPNLQALDVTVWTGVAWRSFLCKPKPRVVEALRRCTILREVAFETDERGLKRSLPEQPDWPSVLFVGDSFTEGLHVASPETFVALYGAAARGAGLSVNVVNGGVNGYSALEEAWTVEQLAGVARARVVVVNLFPNDVERDYARVVVQGAPEASYRRMFGDLARIRDLCDARRIHLVVAALPTAEQARSRAPERFWQQRVAQWCREQRVDYVDPLPAFRGAAAAGLYFDWDPHFSEAGHRLYAEVLFRSTLPRLRAALSD